MTRLFIGVGVLLASMIAAPFVFADDDRGRGRGHESKHWPLTALATSTSALEAQIQSLKAMIEKMKEDRKKLDHDQKQERKELKADIREAHADLKDAQRDLKFVRSLTRGMSGDDVRDLQELLAQDPSLLSPEFITGFFGPRTEEALRKFQRKHGIDAIGIFGPRTQAKLLSLFVGKQLPPGIIKRLGLESSSTTPGAGIVTICHKPAGTSPQSLVIAVPALGAHLAHGDSVGVCQGSGSATTTPPSDTTRPTFSNITVSGIGSTTATIGWNTNEAATGKVYYGTTTPVQFETFLSVGTTSTSTVHSLMLSGLSASTTYYYALESKDVAGNTATSSTLNFITL